jgi:hypothetical protein
MKIRLLLPEVCRFGWLVGWLVDGLATWLVIYLITVSYCNTKNVITNVNPKSRNKCSLASSKGTLRDSLNLENLPRVTQFTVFLYIKFEKLVAMDVLLKGT